MNKLLSIIGLFVLVGLFSCQEEEVRRDLDPTNPFFSEYLTPFGVPPFDQIRPAHYLPAFEEGMSIHREEVDMIVNNPRNASFRNTIRALDNSGEILGKVNSVFFGLSSANTNPEMQKIQLEVSPKLAAHSDEINLDPRLFERVKTIYDKRNKLTLTPEEAFILENIYKDFVRAGAMLPTEKQDEMKRLNQEMAVLAVQFSQNVLAETNAAQIMVDHKNDLKGLPPGSIEAAAMAAKDAGMEGKWSFTAQKPSWIPFLQYAESRHLRKEVYDLWLLRGRQQNEFNNEQILARIMSIRAKKAQLLGYPTHADMVLENRMAKNAVNVMNLLKQVWEPALAAATSDRTAMQEMINRDGGKFLVEPHDWWYYTEKIRKEKYDLDEEELRPYFQLNHVRDGAFDVANKLYGITFRELTDLPKPHEEAIVFEALDKDGSHLGILYQDYHPRSSKRQGAWCGTYRGHHVVKRKEITPVVTMVCNFTRPTGDLPALLSLDEASTLFHEFGHALDALFAENTMEASYRARDFVELPSQIMEHWATEPEVLKSYALHYQTGEPIPDDLIGKMKNTSIFNQGFTSVEFLSACFLDMAYHMLSDTVPVDVPAFEKEALDKIGLIPEIEPRYHSAYFTHITGGYDAGYYSYEWSAVLDHDAFEAFKETSLFDPATAESFRRNILEKNGMVDAMEMWKAFRGREPDITPLMRNRGFLR